MGVRFVFSPKWFYGIDCIFELVSVIVLVLLALSTYKLYKFTKNKHHLYFGASFIALALGFIAKILTNVEIYYPEAIINTVGAKTIFTITGIIHSSLIFTAGYFFYRLFLLLGFLGLIFIITHSKEYRWIPLTVYLVFVITLFSTFAYYIFHITVAVLLFYLAYYLYKNWKKNRKKTKKTVPLLTFLSFLLLFISAIAFVFVIVNSYFYVVAEVLQFLGFLLLLIAYIILVKK